MIWVLLYISLLFIMVSSALLAGRRKDEADFFAQKTNLFVERDEVERRKASM